MEMSGRALAKLTRLLCQCKMTKRMSLSWPWGLNRSPHEIEPLYPLHWAQHVVTGRSGHIDRTLDLSVRSCDACHVSPLYKCRLPDLNGQVMTGRSSSKSPDAEPQRLVVSSKHPEMIFHDRTRPVMLDRTHPASDHTVTPLSAATSAGPDAPRERSDIKRPSVWSKIDANVFMLPLTRCAGPTETSVRSLTVTSVFSF